MGKKGFVFFALGDFFLVKKGVCLFTSHSFKLKTQTTKENETLTPPGAYSIAIPK